MAATTAPLTESARDQWLAERKTFIGGSDVFKLLNEKQYGLGCVRALAYDKLGFSPDYPDQLEPEDLAIMERGNILEPVVADLYAGETGRKLRRPPFDENGTPRARRHPEFPWAGVHADRIVLSGHGGVEETGTAEIKTRNKGPFLRVLREGLFPGDLLQIQHGMWVNDHSWGPFITLGVFDGLPIKHFDIKRDENVIDIIKREGDEFAETVWVKGQLPERPFPGDDERCKVCAYRMECRGEELDRAEAAALKAIKKGDTPLVQISSAPLSQALADLQAVKKQQKELETTEELLKADAALYLGDTQAAFVEGFGKVYFKPQAGRSTAELGKLMDYLKSATMDAGKVADELAAACTPELLESSPVLGQAISILKNLGEAPEVIAKNYIKTGAPFRPLRMYPVELQA